MQDPYDNFQINHLLLYFVVIGSNIAISAIKIIIHVCPLAFYYTCSSIRSRSRGTVLPDYPVRIVDPISLKYDMLFPLRDWHVYNIVDDIWLFGSDP